MAFWWKIRPTWPPKGLRLGGGMFSSGFQAWRPLEGAWRPLGSSWGPRQPQEPILIDFASIFN
eukprot:12425568-Karenia_brevis.AAC.1